MSTDLLFAAEREIAAILANLEKRTGQRVDSIRVDSFETTGVSDTRKVYKRQVLINLVAIPESDWS
jgi:hypothetical protein